MLALLKQNEGIFAYSLCSYTLCNDISIYVTYIDVIFHIPSHSVIIELSHYNFEKFVGLWNIYFRSNTIKFYFWNKNILDSYS